MCVMPGQRGLEPLTRLSQCLPHSRIRPEIGQGDLLQLLRHQQLAQGDAQLPRVDLPGAEERVAGADPPDRRPPRKIGCRRMSAPARDRSPN